MIHFGGHSSEWNDGRRNGIKFAIRWLHLRAREMNDSHAKGILDTAAFNLGVEDKMTDLQEPKRIDGDA